MNKKYTVTQAVSEKMTAKAVKSGSLRVLATPVLTALLEEAACGCLEGLLEEGMTSVGTEISVKHLAATPVGMTVTATAELLSLEGRKAEFALRAEDEQGLIGEGTHTRVAVAAERFQQKADAKGRAV